jgi:hypothetical protein
LKMRDLQNEICGNPLLQNGHPLTFEQMIDQKRYLSGYFLSLLL